MAYAQPAPGGYADVSGGGYAYPGPSVAAGAAPQPAPPAVEPSYAPPAAEEPYAESPAPEQPAPLMSSMPPSAPAGQAPPVQQQPAPPMAQPPMPLPPAAQPSPAVETPVPAVPAEPQTSASAAQPAPVAAEARPEDQAKAEEEYAKRMEEGAAAFATGDYDKARHAFVLAILATSNNLDAKLAYSITQFAIGDYHVAAILLQQVMPAHPEIVYSDFDLRERYEKKEKMAQQIETLRAFAKAHPKDVEPLLVLGFVQHFSDQRDQAKQTFTEALKLSPKETVASIFLNPPPMPQAPTTQPAARPNVTASTAVVTTQPAAGATAK